MKLVIFLTVKIPKTVSKCAETNWYVGPHGTFVYFAFLTAPVHFTLL